MATKKPSKKKDDLAEIFDDAAATELKAPTQGQLSKITTLAKELVRLEALQAKAEAHLSETKKKVAAIAEVELPDAMDEVGLKEFAMSEGGKVTVKRSFIASIKKDNEPEAFKWLRDNEHGALIKRDILCRFGMDQEKAADKLVALLKKSKQTYAEKAAVHSGTLKAFVNEQMTSPVDPDTLKKGQSIFPQDLFGVFPYRKASVK